MNKMHLIHNSYGRFAFRKRSFIQWMVFLTAFWSFLFMPVSGFTGPLGYLKYLPDGILLVLLVLASGRRRFAVRREILPPLLVAVCFFVYVLLGYLFQYQSVAYFLWGFRNNFRFLIAFFAFIAWLDETDINTWFKVLDILFWINVVLSCIQFIFLGIDGDRLGGIFGIQGSSNGYTLCFFSIVVGRSLLAAYNGTEPLFRSILKCGVSVIIAAMAEMKFYYFVVVLLLVGAALITRFSGKKLMLILVAMGVIMLGSTLLVTWFGFQDFFSLESLWESATRENYSSQSDINRLSAIPTLARTIVTNPLNQLFGLGLGNCDTSSFAICNTPFFQTYGHLHYTWFTSAMIFLETGYIGLGIYITFFVVCFLRAYRQYKAGKGNLLHNQLAILISLVCFITITYNASLRTEAGYMMYFVLALPFIQQSSGEKRAKTIGDS